MVPSRRPALSPAFVRVFLAGARAALVAALSVCCLSASPGLCEDYLSNQKAKVFVHERHPTKYVLRRGSDVPQRFLAGYLFQEFAILRDEREKLSVAAPSKEPDKEPENAGFKAEIPEQNGELLNESK